MDKSIPESNKNNRYLYLSIGIFSVMVVIVFYIADLATSDNSSDYLLLGLACMFWSRALEDWCKLKDKAKFLKYFKFGYWFFVSMTIVFFTMAAYEKYA